jgi:hypothetical protein
MARRDDEPPCCILGCSNHLGNNRELQNIVERW